jgi:hypothetical protein
MGTAEILTVWESATDAQMDEGMAWYGEAHATAQRFSEAYGVTLEMAAGVIAATSPNNSWVCNVMVAERILSTRDTSRGYLKIGLAKAQRILDGEAPADVLASKNAFKVLNFYKGIVSNGRDGICIDRHAWDVYTGIRHTDIKGREDASIPVRPRVAGKRYWEVAQAYEEAAEILSARLGSEITACIVQSVTWVAWRERYWSTTAFKVKVEA